MAQKKGDEIGERGRNLVGATCREKREIDTGGWRERDGRETKKGKGDEETCRIEWVSIEPRILP